MEKKTYERKFYLENDIYFNGSKNKLKPIERNNFRGNKKNSVFKGKSLENNKYKYSETKLKRKYFFNKYDYIINKDNLDSIKNITPNASRSMFKTKQNYDKENINKSYKQINGFYNKNINKVYNKGMSFPRKSLNSHNISTYKYSSSYLRNSKKDNYSLPVKVKFKVKSNYDIKKDSNKFLDAIANLYGKISSNIKKNRKYLKTLFNKNYCIKLYLIRHSESLHNRSALDNPNKLKEEFYKNPKYVDCKLSEEGEKMCNYLKSDEKYKEILNLYNEYLKESNNTINNKISSKNKSIFDRNHNFVIICSPLRRCLETLKKFLNFKKNILVYDAVRETSGNYYCDEKSKTSEVKKYCDENFEDYNMICFGENDMMPAKNVRETRSQIECRCLQFLKLVHSLAINYFSNLERRLDELDNRKNIKKYQNTKKIEKNHISDIDLNNQTPDDTIKTSIDKDDSNKVYNVVLVSHSSYICHLLSLLDYCELDGRLLNHCEIKEISIPLVRTFLYYNNITYLHLARPIFMNTIPLRFKNQSNALKNSLKEKFVYTLNQHTNFQDLICIEPCTVLIYRYDVVIQNPNNHPIIDQILQFIKNNNENEKQPKLYNHGIYKNFIFKNTKYSRKILINDATNFLKYNENTNNWEIKNKSFFLRQNVIIFVLPYLDIKIKKNVNKFLDNKNELKYLENIKEVVNNYEDLDELMKSSSFWKAIKDNIKDIDINSFQEFLIKKYNKIVSDNMNDVCYVDLIDCINNNKFIEENNNKCNGYFKKLKEKYDKNLYIDFEYECKYINDNLLNKIFDEYNNLDNLKNNNVNKSNNIIQKNNDNKIDNLNTTGTLSNADTTIVSNDIEKNNFCNIIKRKFIYIPKKGIKGKDNSGINNSDLTDTKQHKELLDNYIQLLKSLPNLIQNLNVEVFYQDNYFYIHCLHKFIKSKNKLNGIVVAKLLCYLDILKSYDTNISNSLYQKLSKLEQIIDINEKNNTNEKPKIAICENKSALTGNTYYCTEGIQKYKNMNVLPDKKKNIVDDLNYLRYNVLTVSGGANKVFIINITT